MERQEFPFVYDETPRPVTDRRRAAVPVLRMSYSESTPAGGVTSTLAVVPRTRPRAVRRPTTPARAGKVALVSRGTCTFGQKATAAAEAGAVAVLVYNNVPGPVNGTLGGPVPGSAPAAGLSQADGQALATQNGAAVTLDLQGLMEDRTSYNVIAETQTGRHNNVVMAGAHLDSVAAGPGINDNGTGSAALLETALQLGGSPKVNNAVRFAWWSAEELGLVGSEYYVQNLDFEQQLDIALYLNFDMIGSPNAGYFTFDGDDSDGDGAGPGPYGSGQIEAAFGTTSTYTGVPLESRDFDGRSDYGEFILQGIPAGGMFTGAEVVKTEDAGREVGRHRGPGLRPVLPPGVRQPGQRRPGRAGPQLGRGRVRARRRTRSAPRTSTASRRGRRAKTRAAAARAAGGPVAAAGPDDHHGVLSWFSTAEPATGLRSRALSLLPE